MFTIDEKIKYIKDNIDLKSRKDIMNHLLIKSQTLSKIMRDNNIGNSRIYRYCPNCNSIIYHSNILIRIRQENEGRCCLKCSNSGQNNAFYGKTHSDYFKNYLKDKHKGKRYSIETEFKLGSKGNTMSNYDCWVNKYGIEVANNKLLEFKKKQSDNNKGIKNPMYGKKSPIGSGNGWSGWYKGWYFRSLLELSYMLFVIDRFNLDWECGEKRENKIEYYINGEKKNYFPDFIIKNKYVIECKPKKLWNTPINKIKFKYAKSYCKSNNLVFKVIDCYKIKKEELISIYKTGAIKFIEKYESKISKLVNY